MSKHRIIYYDDSFDEAGDIKNALERANPDLDVTLLSPPRDLAEVRAQVPDADLFLVDYELALPQATGVAGYYGTTLAAHLKTLVDDRPVLVITKQSVLD